MAKHVLWHDEYWLPLMQLYLRRPQGIKPQYDRGMVELALDLHITPQYLYKQMLRLQYLDTPRIQKLWDRYAEHPKKLAHAVSLLRQMSGFGSADTFYAGVEVCESWELSFKPVGTSATGRDIIPAQLVMILDLYYRLVPATMVPQTPEIIELGKLIGLTPDEISDIMEVFRFCDPLLTEGDIMIHPLLHACMQTWKQWSGETPEKLAAHANQLRDYWR